MSPKFTRSKERKLNRKKNFNYSDDGAYFITSCVQNKIPCLGEVKNGKMILNKYGKIVQYVWNDLPKHYSNCFLGEFVVMPNHVHGILYIDSNVGTGLKPVPTKQYSLSEIIRGLKTFSSRKINKTKQIPNFRWQRSFHDRIIRNEEELENISHYIESNPQMWNNDKFNLTQQ